MKNYLLEHRYASLQALASAINQWENRHKKYGLPKVSTSFQNVVTNALDSMEDTLKDFT
jgi:hypothetical protein